MKQLSTAPKLDVNVKPAIGNEYTLSTCQLDFCLPAKFNLSYIDKDGTKKTPGGSPQSDLSSLGRFMAYILEETKGNLPAVAGSFPGKNSSGKRTKMKN